MFDFSTGKIFKKAFTSTREKPQLTKSALSAGALLSAGLLVAPACFAGGSAAPQLPQCSRKIGTVAVTTPEGGDSWWLHWHLESPATLIKYYVNESGCFTLVDRGKGLAAAKKERSLAGNGQFRQGSNVGKGQMEAADYVLVPGIVNGNHHASAHKIGGLLGGLIGGHVGTVLGGISFKKKTADVLLTLTDVRSTEQVAMEQGNAGKTDIGWGGGAGAWVGALVGAGAEGYANTTMGQVLSMAYLKAYKKMVGDLQVNAPNHEADNVQQAVSVLKSATMYTKTSLTSQVVRTVKPGMLLYPTGKKFGVWWQVTDALGHSGWVISTQLKLAH